MARKPRDQNGRQEDRARLSVLGLADICEGFRQPHVIAFHLQRVAEPASGVANELQKDFELLINGPRGLEYAKSLFWPKPVGDDLAARALRALDLKIEPPALKDGR